MTSQSGESATTLTHVRSQTFSALDGIRGVAALLIAMRHTDVMFSPILFQESYLAVDLFFVMSGAVLCHAYEQRLVSGYSPWSFMWHRIVRIYPLYLVGLVIGVIAVSVKHEPVNLAAYIALALFMLPVFGADIYPLNGPTWSLFFELIANFLYGFGSKFFTSRLTWAVVIAMALLLIPILVVVKSHSLNIGFWIKSFPTGFVRVGFSFFAGILVYRNRSRRMFSGTTGNLLAWILMLFVALLLTASPSKIYQPVFDWISVVVVFPALVAFALTLVVDSFTRKIFSFLGTISYGIYVIHAPTAQLVQELIPVSGGPWFGCVFLACLICVIWVLDSAYDIPVRRALLAKQRSIKVGAR